MGKLFGPDGIRGVVGENLTADMAFRVGQAVGTVLMEEKGGRPTVVIGKDTRISSDMLEAALTAGILSVGGDVLSVGTIPTPAVAFLARQEGADAGIVISASHNPYEHNGIKLFSGQGYKLSDEVEGRIEDRILSEAPMKLRTRGEIGRLVSDGGRRKVDYIDFVASTISEEMCIRDRLSRIVTRSAGILNVEIEPDGAYEIARRSRGTPRIANRMLRRVRDFARVKADGVITAAVADEALTISCSTSRLA